MAKKKGKANYGNIFAFLSEETQETLQSTEKNDQSQNLWEIRPDPNQPRSLLPSELAKQFEAGALTPQEVLETWTKSPSQAYSALQTLAQSIAQHGLINPISVRDVTPKDAVSGDVKYIIVTGERRWWAHVLLFVEQRQIYTGDTTVSPEQIKVNLTYDGVSIRAHQIIENLVREDLNVVEKARGMWALREELSFESEKLVPWKIVEKSLGISKAYRIRITNSLKLTEEAIQLIQKHNFSEYTIRPIVQKLQNEPALQLQALTQLIAWQLDPSEQSTIFKQISDYVDSFFTTEEEAPKGHQLATVEEPLRDQSQQQVTNHEAAKGRQLATVEEPLKDQSQQQVTNHEAAKGRQLATVEEPLRDQNQQQVTNHEAAKGRQLATVEEPLKDQSRQQATVEEEVGSAAQSEITTTRGTTPQELPSQEQETVFPKFFEKATKAEDVTNLIMMANAAGANAWRFDELKFAKLTTISKEGKQIEYEVPRPHQRIVVLMFPEIESPRKRGAKESHDPASDLSLSLSDPPPSPYIGH